MLMRAAGIVGAMTAVSVVAFAGTWFYHPKFEHGQTQVSIKRGVVSVTRPLAEPFRPSCRMGGEPEVITTWTESAPLWPLVLLMAISAVWLWDIRRRGRIGMFRWSLTAAALIAFTFWVSSARIGYRGAMFGMSIMISEGQVIWMPDSLLWRVSERAYKLSFWGPIEYEYSARFPMVLVVAPIAALALVAWRFAPRPIRPGHCRKCGYDLRGSGDRCPECGTRTPAGAPAAAIVAEDPHRATGRA